MTGTAYSAERANSPSNSIVNASTVNGAPAAANPVAISTVLPAASRLSGSTWPVSGSMPPALSRVRANASSPLAAIFASS
ncbi:hypothetical protein D3C80_1692040 [compost metagenome]